jgi:hypothetical protein
MVKQHVWRRALTHEERTGKNTTTGHSDGSARAGMPQQAVTDETRHTWQGQAEERQDDIAQGCGSSHTTERT